MSGTEQIEPGVQNIDRRVARTRRALVAAMVESLQEQSFDDLTVSGLATRADVGRTTFYDHFDGKAQLLDAVIDELFGNFSDATSFQVDQFVEHVMGEPRLCFTLLSIGDFRDRCTDALSARLDGPNQQRKRFAAHGLVGTLHDWSRDSIETDDARPPDQLLGVIESILASATSLPRSPR